MNEQAQLLLEPLSSRFDTSDERWWSQVVELLIDLRRDVGDVSSAAKPVAGAKGAVGPIMLSLASGGSLTAMVECVKAWLGRDGTRSLKASWSADGNVQSVELEGSRLDDSAFNELLQAVLSQLAGSGDE